MEKGNCVCVYVCVCSPLSTTLDFYLTEYTFYLCTYCLSTPTRR